jgi:hypothetical protein
MSSEKPIQSRPDGSNETWETTAQWAKAEASTLELSDEVEKNARKEAEAAKQAAGAAPVRCRAFVRSRFAVLILAASPSILPLEQPTRRPRRPKRSMTSSATRV